jgi:hypothetical protein
MTTDVHIEYHSDQLTLLQKDRAGVDLHLTSLLGNYDALILLPYGWDLNEPDLIPLYRAEGHKDDLIRIRRTARKRQNFIQVHTNKTHHPAELGNILQVTRNFSNLEVIAAGIPLRMLEHVRTNLHTYNKHGKRWYLRTSTQETFGKLIGERGGHYATKQLPASTNALVITDSLSKKAFINSYQKK